MRKIIVVIFIIATTGTIVGQKDYKTSYIIMPDGDTIYGLGYIGRAQQVLYFMLPESKEVQQFTAEELRAFRIIDGRSYITQEVTEPDGLKQWYFLELLVQGRVHLYIINKGTRFFIWKEGEEMVELISEKIDAVGVGRDVHLLRDRKYIGYLRAYMQELTQLHPRIDNLKTLNRNIMVRLTNDYNSILNQNNDHFDYTSLLPKATIRFEAVTGQNFHNDYYSPYYGLLVHISRPVISERLFIKTGVIYSDKPHHKKDREWDNAWQAWLIKNKNPDPGIKIPISIEYVFGNGRIRPTLEYGFPTGVFLVSSLKGGLQLEITRKIRLSANGAIDAIFKLPIGNHPKLFDNNFGHSFGGGLSYQIN